MKLTSAMNRLVKALELAGPRPTPLHIARIISEASVTAQDVAPFVHGNPRVYNRAHVARRDDFELLVMTWLPGQASAPHDHGGSAAVVRVIQGEAREGVYTLDPEGHAVEAQSARLGSGAVTAFADASAHVIANDTQDVLVTLHVYAPPLSTFRSFVSRPGRPEPAQAPAVAVIGGGYSGAMLAAQLLRNAKTPLRVALIERRGAVGQGVAYATREPEHLLNVPAKNMSAWPDRPGDFVEWAKGRAPAVSADDFLGRGLYGDYIRETLLEAARDARPGVALEIIYDEVRRLSPQSGGGWLAHFAHGSSRAFAAVALTTGHCAPADPLREVWRGERIRFIADPWRPFALDAARPDEPVVIIGSGLTAVDSVLSLSARERSAPITLVSLRGFAPQSHSWPLSTPLDLSALVEPLLAKLGGLKVLALLTAVRRAVRAHVAEGGDWRSVVDGLRPRTVRLWRALSLDERRKFLRRVRPFWEIHRHRLAPQVSARLQSLMAEGKVRIVAGHVLAAQAEADKVRMIVFDRKARAPVTLDAGWVVNCTGPTPSNRPEANPVIASLLLQGLLQPDALGLGVETADNGAALTKTGEAQPDLLVLGTLRKPAFWECIAVPELRGHAARAAETLLALPKLRGVTPAAQGVAAE